MTILLSIFASTIRLLLSVVSFLMLLRMILSLLPLEDGNRIEMFCYAVTEPFVIPVRYLFYRLNIGQNSPFDFAFTAAYFLIALLQILLPVV